MMSEKMRKEILKRVKKVSFKKNPCFYIYDLNKITSQIGFLQKNMPQNVDLFYSIKANPHDRIIKHINSHSYIKGVEIASLGDLNNALKIFHPQQVIFTGPGKTPYAIRMAIKKKIGYFVVESYLEALRIQKVAEEEKVKSVNIFIRINIDFKASLTYSASKLSSTQLMSGLSTKFGIDECNANSLFVAVGKLDRLVVQGIHVMTASEQLNYRHLLTYFKHVFQLVKKLSNKNLNIQIIDFGGGFGIDYEGKNKELDIILFGKGFNHLIKKYGFEKRILIFELGKYLVGESGYYVTEIIDIKESRGKKHIITAGGINHNIRPLLAGIHYSVSVISLHRPKLYSNQISVTGEKVDIGGPLSSSLDTFFKDMLITEAHVGDLFVIHHSGAYSLTLSPVNFISHPIPKEYFTSFNN